MRNYLRSNWLSRVLWVVVHCAVDECARHRHTISKDHYCQNKQQGPNRTFLSSPSSSTGEHSLFPFFFPLFISGGPIFLFPFLPQEAVMDVRWMLDGLDRCLDECSDRFGTHKQRPLPEERVTPPLHLSPHYKTTSVRLKTNKQTRTISRYRVEFLQNIIK